LQFPIHAENKKMGDVTQRAASLADLKDVWGLVRQVAGDIPCDLGSEAAQESILSELMMCCTSGLSPIAVGDDKEIVGALLARRDDFEWGFRNSNVIHVSYAAIAPSQKEQGVLRALVADVQGQKVPVLVSVKSGDKFGLADKLKELGFAHESTAEGGWGDLYKWQPAPNGAAAANGAA
jgi:hypothetical protein